MFAAVLLSAILVNAKDQTRQKGERMRSTLVGVDNHEADVARNSVES